MAIGVQDSIIAAASNVRQITTLRISNPTYVLLIVGYFSSSLQVRGEQLEGPFPRVSSVFGAVNVFARIVEETVGEPA